MLLLSLDDHVELSLPDRKERTPLAVASSRRGMRQPGLAMSEPAASRLADAAEAQQHLRDCIAGMRLGDQAALGRLYDATASRLLGVARRIVRQPELAEEVVADVFFQAWRDCTRYDSSRGQVIAWLLVMCRTRSLDALRRQDDAVSHPDPTSLMDVAATADRGDEPDALLASLRQGGRLATALAELSPLQRQLIALAFYKGFTHSEIADHCSMPLGSVKTHLRRALQQLKAALPDMDLGDT